MVTKVPRTGTIALAGYDDERHNEGRDRLGDEVRALDRSRDLDDGARDESDDERLRGLGPDDEDFEAERRDDELGAERAHGEGGERLADCHVEDEAGCQQDGEQHEVADVKPATLGGGYGAGLGEVVLRHGDQPFLLMEEGR